MPGVGGMTSGGIVLGRVLSRSDAVTLPMS